MSLDRIKPRGYRKAPIQLPTPWMIEAERMDGTTDEDNGYCECGRPFDMCATYDETDASHGDR